MSYFGVTGSMSLCSSHIHSNPVTIAAIKRQQEKERQRQALIEQPRDHSITQVSILRRLRGDKKQSAAEERFRAEFLYDISMLRLIAVENAKRLLANFDYEVVPILPQVKARVEDIIRYHAVRSGYSYQDIIGPRRNKKLVAVRQAAMADAYLRCKRHSLPELGRRFGNRDHTTVLYTLKKMGVYNQPEMQAA